ncbi:trypsin-like peptidase domain-containing protein [Micromonospora sp. SH-82]|uniref:S1C family serine protease n=1 Tax=Micromonospora sp. SH-82 TaxID=3132938 RepID=UPI003EB6B8AE
MTEYESDPQRRPATDAEPSHHDAELPRVAPGHSDPAPAGSAPGAPAAGAPSPSYGPSGDAGADTTPIRTEPGDGRPGPYTGSGHAGPYAGQSGPYAGSGQSGSGQSGPYAGSGQSGPYTGPGQSGPYAGSGPVGGGRPSADDAYRPGGQQTSTPPYPTSGAYPGSPWQPAGQHPQPGHPGYGPMGQPVPPWAQNHGPAQRPNRAARYVVAGIVVMGLMFGSGVTGGALALGLSDGSGGSRTFSAAPVINSADLPKIAAAVQDSVVSIATDSGEGSGVILTGDGYVLTNNHVVASARTVTVTFADGKTAQANVVGTDPKTDLAVVKADGVSDLKAATFGDSDAMQVGDQVLALGSPLGLQGSVTSGIVSARDRTIRAGSQQDPQQGASSIAGLLQTDAPINPGNSGGALVNTKGEVIGINTAIATAGQSTGNIGVGFAIPSNKAKDVAEKLQRGEKISHPSLGVSVAGAQNGGALVSSVLPGSAAEQAGLRQGDVITRFGDTTVNDSSDLVGAVQARKVGDRVEVRYQRDGAENTVTVTLTES